jgi:hypothetical protein
VRGRGGHRRCGPGPRRQERLPFALEPERAYAQHAGLGQLLRKPRRHGAEVLADHDGLVAQAFERRQPQQVPQREMQVGPGGRGRAFGHQPQAVQAEYVVDADAAAVRHVGAQHGQPRRETLFAQRARRQRAQSPVLALMRQQVGRGAHAQALEHGGLQTPGLAAARVGPDREVGNDAYRHAGVVRLALQALAREAGLPLQEAVKVHALRVLLREVLHRLPARVAQGLRPSPPVAAGAGRLLLPQPRVQRLEAGMVEQVPAAVLAKPREAFALRCGRGFPAAEQGPQQAQPPARGLRPVHQAGGLQFLQGLRAAWQFIHGLPQRRFAEHARRVYVQHVEKHAARRPVRAEALRCGRKHRMQRAEGQRRCALPRGRLRERFDRAEIRQAAVSRAAQAVDLRGQAPRQSVPRARRGRPRHRPR